MWLFQEPPHQSVPEPSGDPDTVFCRSGYGIYVQTVCKGHAAELIDPPALHAYLGIGCRVHAQLDQLHQRSPFGSQAAFFQCVERKLIQIKMLDKAPQLNGVIQRQRFGYSKGFHIRLNIH